MEQKYIKASEVAAMFGVTRQTIRNWIDKGLLKAEKLDGCHYVTMSSVKAIEDKYADIVVEEGVADAYLKSLRTLTEEYKQSVEEYRNSISDNKVLAKSRFTIARFIPIVYGLLRDGVQTTERGGLIIQRVVEGADVRSIAHEFGVTFERVRQILEKELRMIRQNATPFYTLREENESLRARIATLELNAKNLASLPVERTVEGVPDSILTKRLVDCNLSVRALNCLHSYHEIIDGKIVDSPIETVGDLTRLHKTDLLKMRNCGKKTLIEVDELLKEFGLEWGKRYIVQDDGSIVEISSTP